VEWNAGLINLESICVLLRFVKRLASDRLPERGGRIWTREKLTYLEKYATAFMVAMAKKRGPEKWERLVYLDLLCGPGRDID